VVLFLDYDGTLSPIVEQPDKAFMSDEMRASVKAIASVFTTIVVSGRAKDKVRNFIQLDDLMYAGSHGFDISGPGGLAYQVGTRFLPTLQTGAFALLAMNVHDHVPRASACSTQRSRCPSPLPPPVPPSRARFSLRSL